MKFKNTKKEASAKGGSFYGRKKSKSPSNSRNIPVLNIYRGSLKVFIAFIFMLTAIIVGLDLHDNLQIKKETGLQRENFEKDLKFWESFIKENEDYRDAYFQASILEYRLGNIFRAKMYVEKGLSLDPNSGDGKKLERFLLNK